MVFQLLLKQQMVLMNTPCYFDFGYSPEGVVHNMDALGVDPSKIEELALSHGHMDHTGGLEAVVNKIGKRLKIFPASLCPGQ